MRAALRTLRVIQWAMLASIVFYAVLPEVVSLPKRIGNPSVSYMFSTLAVAIVGVIFVVRRSLVLRSAESLAAHPDDPLALGPWRAGYIITFALCESLALLGVILRFIGFDRQQSLPFYVGGFVLLLFFAPREPVASSTP